MTKPPKIDRKVLKQPDSFQTKGRTTIGWLAERRVTIAPLIGVFIAVGALLYGLDWWKESKLSGAWKSYYDATKLPEPQKWEDLKTVYARFKGTRPGLFAALSLADHFYNDAKNATLKEASLTLPVGLQDTVKSASEWYASALQFGELLPTERQLVGINLGHSHELGGNLDMAGEEYKKAADVAGGDAKAYAMLNQARVLELKKDSGKAVEMYEKVASEFGTTEFGKMAKNQIRRLKSPLFQNAPEGGKAQETGKKG